MAGKSGERLRHGQRRPASSSGAGAAGLDPRGTPAGSVGAWILPPAGLGLARALADWGLPRRFRQRLRVHGDLCRMLRSAAPRLRCAWPDCSQQRPHLGRAERHRHGCPHRENAILLGRRWLARQRRAGSALADGRGQVLDPQPRPSHGLQDRPAPFGCRDQAVQRPHRGGAPSMDGAGGGDPRPSVGRGTRTSAPMHAATAILHRRCSAGAAGAGLGPAAGRGIRVSPGVAVAQRTGWGDAASGCKGICAHGSIWGCRAGSCMPTGVGAASDSVPSARCESVGYGAIQPIGTSAVVRRMAARTAGALTGLRFAAACGLFILRSYDKI